MFCKTQSFNMQPSDRFRFRHMVDAARDAMAFVQGRSRADLDKDRQFTLSVVKCIEIIGEAATKISSEAKEEVPSVPWPDVIGMRHRLIHMYYDVNLDIVWKTATVELPRLVEALEEALESSEAP